MQRAFRRAGIPVWYTQGFNPHPYILFPLPLSIFIESDCEIMDIRLDENMPFETVKSRLSEQMPEGIEILDVSEPVMKHTAIAFAEYNITLEYDGLDVEKLDQLIRDLFENRQVTVTKETKRRTLEIDIKEYLGNAGIDVSDGKIKIHCVLPVTQENNINPSCFAEAIKKYSNLAADYDTIRRTGIYDSSMQIFR